MLTNIFDNRNRYLSNLIKLGDFLARSLRENVELFSIEDNKVTYITESNKVIRGTYSSKNNGYFKDIEVEDSSIFEDSKKFSALVDKRVSGFLIDILENDLSKADDSFDNILKLWEIRLQFNLVKTKLTEKAAKLAETTKILSTPEFQRLVELKSELVKFLKENTKSINVPEIKNAIKLTTAISKSFNLPRVTYNELQESGYKVPSRVSQNLYEFLTTSELIKKELLESKQNFQNIFISNEKLIELASLVYEKDKNKIYESIAKLVFEIPYFALISKKQLSESFKQILITLNQEVPDSTIKNFVGLIFEAKKPVKTYILELLNNKYGINVNNLTDVPTFTSLANSEVAIFNVLSKLAPKNSNLKRTLSEMKDILSQRTGVETIDVCDFLNEVFSEAGYTEFINETSLLQYLDFNKVADDLGKIGAVLKMIQTGMGVGGTPAAGGGMGDMQQMMGGQPLTQDMPAAIGGGMDMDSEGEQYEEDIPTGEENDDIQPGGDAEEAAIDAQTEELPPEEGMEGEMPPEEGMEDEEAAEAMPEEELIGNIKELEELLAVLKSDMGMEDEEGMPPEEGMEGEEIPEGEPHTEEGDEEMANNGEKDVHVDVNVDADDSPEEDGGPDLEVEKHTSKSKGKKEKPDKEFEDKIKKKKK